ncbi:hypothetical protein FK535_19295 [Mycolicibacterium sp. 018/SC-01/001]|uniref:lipopolysaccharide biosynthesis protein n=1 Tax=Mycolicibacterium sp. 018/SC-01/001 TaxID=2592069 RepID=UPI00117C700D|nr:hypothetical protein [Mycolicibacterium sp. 018/SC-01/001]TRW80489.1 hypothetical protein FK535_19295 [Mycolicibacterium sp. 018/SC-01/001]
MRPTHHHLVRAAVATSWNYSGRALGLAWTALMISRLGIDDYGRYAIGMAGAAILNAAIDNAFYVRSLRVDEVAFERERCARVVFATGCAIVGAIVFTEFYTAGFAILVAAGEQLFNTVKSRYLRTARPDLAMRFDAVRQFSSIALAGGYLVLHHDPHLGIATALYVAPYAVILVVCLTYVPGRRPARPGSFQEMSILSSEAVAAALYAQGDLLILGMFAGETVTGYYSVALVTALAIATVGQHYATTFVQDLRATRGSLDTAPRLADTLRVGAGTGCAMAVAGIGILLWGRAEQLGLLIVILSVWVVARTVQYSFIVVLFAQHRDVLRVRATTLAAVGKIALLFPAVITGGALGAAFTAVVCDIALTTYYFRRIYRQNVAPASPVRPEETSA